MRKTLFVSIVFLLVSIFGLSIAIADRSSQKSSSYSKRHKAFYEDSGKSLSLPDPLLNLKKKVSKETLASEKYKEARKARITDLVSSLKAIEDRGVRLSTKDRRKIADAALYAEEHTGVDAVTMLAVGRMESDFRGVILLNIRCKAGLQFTGCFADCGITQHHVQGNRDKVLRYCKKLIRNPRLSFLKSAQELARHVQWCQKRKTRRWHLPLRRCVLNRYNQGSRYKTIKRCRKKVWDRYNMSRALGNSWKERRYPCKYLRRVRNQSKPDWYRETKKCTRTLRKCISRAAYWKKVTCFEYGARNKVRFKKSCRYCYNIPKISTRYY